MPVLHNRVSNEMLKARMLAETEPRTTISFYKYFTIVDPQATRDALYQAFTALNVFGRVYLAREGINAQIQARQLYHDREEVTVHIRRIWSAIPGRRDER